MSINKLSFPIYFQTPENILRIWNATKVWGVPLVVYVDVAAPASAASTTLTASSPSAISPCATSTAVCCFPPLLPLLWEESSAGAET